MEENNSDPNLVHLEGWGYLSHGAYQDIIREQERNRILGVVQNAPAIRDDNGYEIGVDRQALKDEITK